ncbi:unnamed protein product [Phytophthora fragariaefolia]|uniref:Unnamed protein product n=1 Tax=Phytophthora fragariaefolia TaxID=1490495 RepID=A0A9W6XLD4_9STRA|nr:unnamed protein product [Phytophthora fragariaefolia]
MESLYARDTPTAHERKPIAAERELKSDEKLERLADASSKAETGAADSTTDDAFGFSFSALPDLNAQGGEVGGESEKTQQDTQPGDKKTEEGRLAELSGEAASVSTPTSASTEKLETKAAEAAQPTPQGASASPAPAPQPRRAGVASVPQTTPDASFTAYFLLERHSTRAEFDREVSSAVLEQGEGAEFEASSGRWGYLCDTAVLQNDILITLKEQANVDPAFANVVWQKLEEQNPTFFRAYSLQLQLKEQIIAFNYLVRGDHFEKASCKVLSDKISYCL